MQVVTDIYKIPLDEYIEGSDQGDIDPKPLELKSKFKFTTQETAPVFVIPFTRELKYGSTGDDVIGSKRAVWKASGLPIPNKATKLFGKGEDKLVCELQEKWGFSVDGVIGEQTLSKLGPYFDRYAFFLYAGYEPGGSKEQKQRKGIVAYVLWGYNNRALIYYAEYRPMDHMSDLYHLPETEDCSSFATKSYKAGDAPDPNGYKPPYNGWGNTVTMRAHGRIVSLTAAQPGDLVHYDFPQHVMVYLGKKRCGGLGSTPGPLILPYNYRPVHYIKAYL